jgi:hypothetical protein
MKSETPRNDALRKCAAANPKHLIEIMLRKHEQLEIELNAELADKQRLDALEAVPFALEIKYDPKKPKADSLASLRSQIDYFLDQRAAKPSNAGS